MRDTLTTIAEVVGLVLIVIAAGMISTVAGIAVAGCLLVAVGVIGGRP